MANKIKALFIFEILGKPANHIVDTLSQVVDKVGELKGIEILKKKIHEPKEVKEHEVEGIFATFAEVEVLGEDLSSLVNIVFHSMPSHMEIIEPTDFILKNFELSALLSEITVKLHRYDEIAKTLTIEKNIVFNKLKEVQAEKKELEEKFNAKNKEKTKKPVKKKTNKKPKKK